jgi:hypothetical protein
MKTKIAMILGIVFLLLIEIPYVPSSGATAPARQTTTVLFDYTVILFPSNSSWRATITNIGNSTVWNTVSISNSTIQDNEFLLNSNGSAFIPAKQTVQGSFQCHYFNGTIGADSPCTLSRGALYRFCTSVGNNTGTIAFDEALGCFKVRADGTIFHGSTHHRIDLVWKTLVLGGNTAQWYFKLRNVGTRTIEFSATLSWQCDSPVQGWITCMRTTRKITLAAGGVYTLKESFKPPWNSFPVGTSGITASVSATFRNRFHLYENMDNLTAV